MPDFKILPGEEYIAEFGAVIRTRCPKDFITDEMVHQRVVAMNLSAGDFIKVQVFNHERDTVFHFCEYLVVSRKSRVEMVEINDRETRTVEKQSFAVIKARDWQTTPAGEALVKTGEVSVKSKGFGNFDVEDADGKVLKSFTKDEGGKDAAQAYAETLKAA